MMIIKKKKKSRHELELIKNRCYKYASDLIDNKINNLTEEEAEDLMRTFILYAMDKQNIPIDYKDLDVEFLDAKKSKKILGTSYASFNKKGIFKPYKILISRKVKNIVRRAKTPEDLIGLGLQACCHEVVHFRQTLDLKSEATQDWTTFVIALEHLMAYKNKDFYEGSYKNIFLEIMARYKGIELALEFLKNNSRFFEKLNIDDIDLYAEKVLKEKNLEFDSNIDFKEYIEKIFNNSVDVIASKPKIVKEIPVLSYAFNIDGTLKNTQQLLRRFVAESRINEDNEALKDLIQNIYCLTPKDDIENELYILDLFAKNDEDNEEFYQSLENYLYNMKRKERRM